MAADLGPLQPIQPSLPSRKVADRYDKEEQHESPRQQQQDTPPDHRETEADNEIPEPQRDADDDDAAGQHVDEYA